MKLIVEDFLNLSEEQLKQKYKLKDGIWKCSNAKADICSKNYQISKVSYKLFDERYTVHTKKS
jgi:hypothetical protein